jgi:flagellar basal body-associated protein FliL
MTQHRNIFSRVFHFYVDGFRNMTWGRSLWIIILVKLFVMFVVLKIFFFPNFLKTNFNSNEDRSNYVIDEMTKPKPKR